LKGALAKQMLVRAFAVGIPAQWIVGDTIYRYEELRLWLDEQQKNYMLAILETHLIWVGNISYVAMLLLPKEVSSVPLAGPTKQRRRLYAWTWMQLPEQSDETNQRV
jgi:hypothetical protein